MPVAVKPQHRRVYSAPPKQVKLCMPSSPIDRFYFPKQKASNPMHLPDGMETLKTISQDSAFTNRRYAFFLDYDGTLTPIVDNPDKAIIAENTRGVINQLAESFDTAIVTGRSLNKIQDLMKLENCYYAGSHGWDIQGPKGSEIRKRIGEKFLSRFKKAMKMLDEILDRFEGASVEDNVFSISIHYRKLDESKVGELEEEVDRIVEKLGMLKRTGKMVFEIRPAFNWHKGKAVDYLVKLLQDQDEDIIPVYIGDDDTDEDAFKALNGRGISVIVTDEPSDKNTHADLRLSDPSEVREFLGYFARST